MGKNMGKEHTLGMMEVSMLVNSRRGDNMGKEHILGLMEKSMLGNIEMKNGGTVNYLMKTEIYITSM